MGQDEIQFIMPALFICTVGDEHNEQTSLGQTEQLGVEQVVQILLEFAKYPLGQLLTHVPA